MESEIDYWVEEPAEDEGDGTFKPGAGGTIARLILFALLLWTILNMVLPRRNLILNINQPPRPPAEQIEPHYWL